MRCPELYLSPCVGAAVYDECAAGDQNLLLSLIEVSGVNRHSVDGRCLFDN